MATTIVNAAVSVLGKALSPLTGSLLKDWAASVGLGANVQALELELLSVKALLELAIGKDINKSSALKELLVMLQELGYDAEDVLDKLDYFRIQDELDGTFDAADEHAEGGARNLALNVRHTAKAIGKRVGLLPGFSSHGAEREARNSDDTIVTSPQHTSQQATNQELNDGRREKLACGVCNTIVHAVGKCFPFSLVSPACDEDDEDNYSWQQNQTNDPPKLSFNRVDASTRMHNIVEQLRLVQQKVSAIIPTLGPNWSAAPNIAQSRLITTSESIEPKLYGRDHIMSSIIHDITQGKHSGEVLTVIPIVGPGGIGKTTLAQHIYHSREVQDRFDVKVWKCVSLNFNVNKLIEEIEKRIPKVDGESSTDTAGELIGQRIKNKRFLLVLDDIWDCSSEDDWKRLLVPFNKSQEEGNIILVTTRFQAQSQIMIRKIDHEISLKGLKHEEFMELFLDFIFDDDQSREAHKFLLGTGDKIAHKLKGSPLAAKTVGRLLKTQHDLVHWNRVLESKEWEQKDGKDDIMAALKLSYDYLPSRLQQCFYYCALFPQDYQFDTEELINFWIGLDILHSSHSENKRVEDVGLSHLRELVGYGFLETERKKDGSACYIIHDLLHELARKVSSHECLSMDSSSQFQLRFLRITPSIRHLSINIDDSSIDSRLTFKNCVEDFNTLDRKLNVEKLRSLMLFGKFHGCFVKVFGDLFREAKALRVVFLSKASYDVEDLLHNFYNLVHLRYLRIQSSYQAITRFPNKLSRFYHMMVLDTKDCDIFDSPRDMSNLVKLRHFIVKDDVTHSSIAEVGKLRSLQELRRFVVRQKDQGFELRQIGDLVELCGSLAIASLENVQVVEEADEAKLMQKNRLHELILSWNIDRSTNGSALEEHVLERLKPSSELQKLSIIGNRGATCPSWLGRNLSVKNLESLCLDGVAWKTFPPIGELCLVNVPREEISSRIPERRFENLRSLELVNLPWLEKWVVHAPCQLFPFLEVLAINGCSQLVELSFPHFACCQQEKGLNANFFPRRLLELKIGNCPKLLSFPPIPWTKAPSSIKIEGTGHHKLIHLKNYSRFGYILTIRGKDSTQDSTFWDVVDFHNLTELEELNTSGCPTLPLHHLGLLSSLRKLGLSSINAFPFVEGDLYGKYQFPVELLCINGWGLSGKELTRLLTYFPKLSALHLFRCDTIRGLDVMGQQGIATPGPSSSANKVDAMRRRQQQEASAYKWLLLLPPQLHELRIIFCRNLRIRSSPLDNNNEGRTGQGGLRSLSSLQRLFISCCDKFLSSYSSSSLSSCWPFPNSLESLHLRAVAVGMGTLQVPLSNLSSLKHLSVADCEDLRGGGLLSLLAQGHLTQLDVTFTPNFFVDSELSLVPEHELGSYSSKLQELKISDVAAITAPGSTTFRSLLFSSLTTLDIIADRTVECFAEDQEALLFVKSLEKITFQYCSNMQNLPARLYRLPNLKILHINDCTALQMLPRDNHPSSLQELVIFRSPNIQSLPKDCLPSSLQKLEICQCPGIQSLPKHGLPISLQELKIQHCPAIRSLPKVDNLPSSMQELDVSHCGSEELKTQCRKLIGIIPIVRV